jgi:hypothetical protein
VAALNLAGAMANLKTMLSGLTAWTTICTTAGGASAALRIYEGGTEQEGETLAPCIFLDFTSLPTNWIGQRFTGRLSFEIRCEFPIPKDNRLTYSDEYLYAWGFLSDMLAGINGAVGGAGQLMADSLEVATAPARISPEENQGRVEWGFILTLSVKVI